MRRRLLLYTVLFFIGIFRANAQLVINEFSQGTGGTREYFELVVVGTRTCNDSTEDIRGWVFDDHNGWYGAAGTGIAAGHLRFANIAQWQNVKIGSIILLYNSADKNTAITLADDPTDANNDKVYVIPVSSSTTVIEGFSGAPTSPSSPTYVYPTTGYSTAANNWNYLGLSNSGDGVVLVKPTNLGVAAHSVIFFNSNGAPFQIPNVELNNVGSGDNAYLTNASYNNVASWSIGNAGVNETPGAPNGGANTTWINGMLAPATIPPTPISAAICAGGSYTFAGIPRTTAGNYTNTFTSIGGCDSIVNLTLTVNPAPVISSVTPVQPDCGGLNGALLVNGLASSTTYTVSYVRGAVPVTGLTFTSNAAGTLTIPNLISGTYTNVTVSIGLCTSTAAGPYTLFSAPPPPAPTATSNSPICEGSTLNLSVTGQAGATFSWTGPNGFTSTLANPSIPNATFASTGTYSVRQTVAGCQSIDAQIIVTVNIKPAFPTISSNSPVCTADTLKLFSSTTTTGVAYNWSGPNGFSSTAQNPVLVNPTVAATGTYFVSVSKTGCSSAQASTAVIINQTPALPTITSNSPVCSGSSINLTAAPVAPGATTYAWSGPGGFTATTSAVVIPAATTANAGTYSVVVTQNGCNSLPASTVVVVNPTPVISTFSGTNPSTCGGNSGSILLTGLTPNTSYVIAYSRNGVPATTTVTSSAAGTVTLGTLNAATYSAITAQSGSCTSAPVGPVSLSDPGSPATPGLSNNGPLCEGATLNLTASAVTGAVYSWSGPGGYTSAVQNPTRANALPTMLGYYRLTVTVSGCTSAPDSTNVLIKPKPATPIATGNGPVCAGDTIRLNAAPPTAGATYTWTGPNGYTASGLAQNFIATAASAGYYGILASLNGCSSGKDSVNVLVSPRPVVTGSSSTNPSTCGGSNGTITLNGLTPNATYTATITKNGVPQVLNVVANSAGGLVFTGLTAGTYTISDLKFLGGACSAASVGPISLSAPSAPPAPVASYNGPVCEGSLLQFTATGVAGSSFEWSGPNGYIALVPNPSIINVTSASAGTYSVTQTVNGCVSPSAFVNVVVLPRPATPIATGNSPVCTSDTIKLSVSNPIVGATYSWTGPGGFTSASQNPRIPNPALSATGTYTVIATVGACNSLPGMVNILVNQTPPTPTIVSNSPVCTGSAITLSSSSTGTAPGTVISWNGPNGFTAATANISIPNATIAQGGTYTVVYTTNGCASMAASAAVIVTPNPVIASAIGTDPAGCNTANGSILITGLTANSAYLISYSRNGTPVSITLTANASGNITITGLTAATYSNITAKLGNCTSAPAGPITLTEPAAPAPPVPGNNGPLCSGATLNLTASTIAGATYSWTGPNGYASNLQNPSIPNVTTAATGSYSVRITIGTCISAPAVTSVVVNQSPAVPVASSNSPVCAGSSINLTASSTPGATYSWSGPNSFTSNLQNPVISNATTAATGLYTVTATLGTCFAVSQPTNVSVVPLPSAPVLSNAVFYCQGAIAQPLTAIGTNLKFYTVATGGTGVTTLIPSTVTAGTFNYYVSQSTGACEGPRALIAVTINPKSAAPVAATEYTYCQYEVAPPLTATGPGIRWYTTPTGNIPLAGAPTPNTQVPGTYNFYVSSTDGLCESDRIKISVVVLPKPAPPGVISPTHLCQYDTVQLTADGQNLRWYFFATGGGGMSPFVPPTRNDDITFYYVTQTVNGCESDRARMQVIVDYKPNGIITASRPWLCAEDTITFRYFGNARPDAVYNWKTPSPQSRYISGGGQGPYVVQYDSSGTSYVSLTINNNGCLSDLITLPVEVRPLPSLGFVMKPLGCVDEAVNIALSALSPAIDSFTWNFDNGNVFYSASTGGPYGVKWNTAGTKVVSVVATTATCGSRTYRDTILIQSNPDVRISRLTPGNVCTGDSVELSIANEPGSTYLWAPYQFFDNRARMASTVFATPDAPGYVTVKATSAAGCKSMDSIYLDMKPCCEVYFPNVFSPNGDGRNDVFRAVTIGNHEIAAFRVINRWGQVVFESKDERRGWDGTFNGKAQDVGTFYYFFRFRCSNNSEFTDQKGEFMLMR